MELDEQSKNTLVFARNMTGEQSKIPGAGTVAGYACTNSHLAGA